MKSNNAIYSFFIALALLFWNPVTYYLIYADTLILSPKEHYSMYVIYAVIFLGGVLLIYLIIKNRLPERAKNVALTAAFTGILFSCLVVIDGIVGLTSNEAVGHTQDIESLIFKPDSKARYRTAEYDCIVEINSMGLRDREINVEKGSKFRILCFGDSWTFGWGVNIENSWPKKLERFLLDEGYDDIEVINLGQGGQYPRTYRKYMEKAVPILQPDLILVGVLQSDDLAQYYESSFINRRNNTSAIIKNISARILSVSGKYLICSFENILLILGGKDSETIEIQTEWETSSATMMEKYSQLQKIRFLALDDSVRNLFRSGNLNPSLVDYYINFPERLVIFNNQNHPATRYSAREMRRDFRGMKDICKNNNAILYFVNLPINYYTGHQVIRTPGDVLNSYFETHNNIDSIYRSVATECALPYIELTQHFMGLQDKSEYFFRYDGHPNERGYEEIAFYIGKQLIENSTIQKEKQ